MTIVNTKMAARPITAALTSRAARRCLNNATTRDRHEGEQRRDTGNFRVLHEVERATVVAGVPARVRALAERRR
jgi:hypothetical protein